MAMTMDGKNRIMIYGPKEDGQYVVSKHVASFGGGHRTTGRRLSGARTPLSHTAMTRVGTGPFSGLPISLMRIRGSVSSNRLRACSHACRDANCLRSANGAASEK